jgi:hypothetical protein
MGGNNMNSDRQTDLNWIAENLAVLSSKTESLYREHGKGALLIDHNKAGTEPNWHYLPAAELPREDGDTQRMVQRYDPEAQFVIVLLKSGDRQSSYQVGRQPKPAA